MARTKVRLTFSLHQQTRAPLVVALLLPLEDEILT